MKYLDLFGGIGGFRYGIEKGSKGTWRCVWYNDYDKYAVQTYNKNYGTKYKAKDISTVKTSEVPDHDLICGGFPCQTFSLAGSRKGFSDIRGTMFFEIMRIAKAKRTKYLFLENVKGLLNHDKGKTFTTIIQTLEKLGYDTQWMVLNSKFFGVPQNRERVFIIGSLRGEPRPEILPFRKDAREVQRICVYTQDKITHKQIKGLGHSGKIYNKKGVIDTMVASMGTGGNNVPMVHSLFPRSGDPTKGGTGHLTKQDGNAYCLDSGNCQAIQSPTLTKELRRLTPIECERLQGFPDNWTKGVSDTQRYRQLGNAVTTNVIEAIVRSWNENNNKTK